MEKYWNLPELLESDHQALNAVSEICNIPPNTTIIQQGQSSSLLRCIISGTVRVERERGGEMREIAQCGAGALLGEISFVSRETAVASVTSLTECQLIQISQEALEKVFLESGGLQARLYEGIARIISERLRANRTLPPAKKETLSLPSWQDTLASVRTVVLPPVVETYIQRYERVGHRSSFLWRWCWRGLQQTALGAVPEMWRTHTLSAKLIAIIFNVLLDDIADHTETSSHLEYVVDRVTSHVPFRPTLELNPPVLPASLSLMLDLWQTIEGYARVLPHWEKYRPLWYFDYQQVFTAMRYSSLTHSFNGLDNVAENRSYVPHNMNMMVFATIDLMTFEITDEDLGYIRQAVWHAQSIGQIGNMVATWRRETPDRDFASRVFTLARERAVVTREELMHLSAEEIIERLEQSGVEEVLLAELYEHRKNLKATVKKVHSIDMNRYSEGVDQLLAMSLAAKGYI
jgi:CRP-like cAMP-binding protein